MAKNKKMEFSKEKKGFFHGLSNETKQGILAIIFFVLTLLFLLASFSKAGLVGEKVYSGLTYLLGIGYYLIPAILLMLGISFLKTLEQNLNKLKIIGSILLLISGLGIITLTTIDKGGVIGNIISYPLLKLFGMTASMIILIAIVLISLLILFEAKFTVETLFFWRRFRKEKSIRGDISEVKIANNTETVSARTQAELELKEREEAEKAKKQKKDIEPKITPAEEEKFSITNKQPLILDRAFVPPPLSLLEQDKGKPGVGDIKANANIIKRTLQNFGIDVEMDEVSIGPSITRYALKPAEGVRLSKIVALQDNLALALAAHPIRIEAPIPGKSLVGVEIPNTTKTTVGLGTLLANDEYQTSDKPLLVALGKGISGRSHFSNLAKMPHCLIAGTTGSGKSVTIHAIITSLLYRNSPESLKFIMIDPKRVELTLYNKIPHLLTPVITEAKKTILSLKWAAKEMDRRYDLLESHAVKDIDSYHKNVLKPGIEKITKLQKEGETDESKLRAPDPMPFIVIVIDELADIMMTFPRELESAIVRLAQMSRAVGIHLIVSTQRPSVNVITGLIKANIPSRIALQVASQVDSRTILDTIGAEKLLGAGDMLYIGSEMSKPQRIQSAFISETEVKKVVKYLKETYEDSIPSDITMTNSSEEKNALFDALVHEDNLDMSDDDDDLYEQAKAEIMQAGKASTSYIQRKLRVGYARAARLMDLLEKRGVIGPSDGAKPREVIGGGSTNNPESTEDNGDVETAESKDILS
ncbi:MAG: DNA translocase FtsK 4TM domain-containing protein [Candidatus Paceibacterota bacterium]|jgi:S-DNA-T family DNA segregation ATPase FtsK/SpoIIIE